jgi:ABC-2 type transport system permease protein
LSAIGFGVNVGRPLPLIAHFVGVILMSTGLMVFFYGFISSERTADAVMSVIIIIMALFGGSMIPFEQLNGTLQAIGRFSPVYWAADGFKQIFMMDAGLTDIAKDLVVVYSIAVVTLLPGSFLLEKKLKAGD